MTQTSSNGNRSGHFSATIFLVAVFGTCSGGKNPSLKACFLLVNLVPRCALQKSELFYNSSTIHVAYVHDSLNGYLFIFEA